MTKDEIIDGLLDNAQDRRSLVPPDEPDSIFAHDAEVMDEAVKLINQLWADNLRLRRRVFPWGILHRYSGKRIMKR